MLTGVATDVPILDFKSRVSAARKKPATTSLRTTIPEEVARLLELKPGDVLKWAYDTKQEGKAVVHK
jgi:bifunctional DNA-binding transcriptional regulator/antitoxin component of YhaV-PrlF toxin-antitoxin module